MGFPVGSRLAARGGPAYIHKSICVSVNKLQQLQAEILPRIPGSRQAESAGDEPTARLWGIQSMTWIGVN